MNGLDSDITYNKLHIIADMQILDMKRLECNEHQHLQIYINVYIIKKIQLKKSVNLQKYKRREDYKLIILCFVFETVKVSNCAEI